jgi:hypothetical protein
VLIDVPSEHIHHALLSRKKEVKKVDAFVHARPTNAQQVLAETNLKRLEQSNKRMPRLVPSSIVAEYQHDVQVAKTRLKKATAGQTASDFQVWLHRAEAERRAAETTWSNATAANARAPGTFQPLDVERFRLRAEVAKLQLERGRMLVDSGHEAQLQWEIDMSGAGAVGFR